MTKIRVLVEMDEDIYDELCSYPERRVNIIEAEDADIPKEDSNFKFDAWANGPA